MPLPVKIGHNKAKLFHQFNLNRGGPQKNGANYYCVTRGNQSTPDAPYYYDYILGWKSTDGGLTWTHIPGISTEAYLGNRGTYPGWDILGIHYVAPTYYITWADSTVNHDDWFAEERLVVKLITFDTTPGSETWSSSTGDDGPEAYNLDWNGAVDHFPVYRGPSDILVFLSTCTLRTLSITPSTNGAIFVPYTGSWGSPVVLRSKTGTAGNPNALPAPVAAAIDSDGNTWVVVEEVLSDGSFVTDANYYAYRVAPDNSVTGPWTIELHSDYTSEVAGDLVVFVDNDSVERLAFCFEYADGTLRLVVSDGLTSPVFTGYTLSGETGWANISDTSLKVMADGIDYYWVDGSGGAFTQAIKVARWDWATATFGATSTFEPVDPISGECAADGFILTADPTGFAVIFQQGDVRFDASSTAVTTLTINKNESTGVTAVPTMFVAQIIFDYTEGAVATNIGAYVY